MNSNSRRTGVFRALTVLCGAALISLAGCKVPATPTGVTATTGNAQTTISWLAVPGATSYNVYSSPISPVTTSGTKINVGSTDATLSALANGTPVFAVVTAVNSRGESALSAEVCAVPTVASTAGLTMYDPLCSGTLDGKKWRTPLSSRSVSNGALELSTKVANMESRTIRGLSYLTTANVNAAGQRVTTLKADITVPAAAASRTGSAELRAGLQVAYHPPANRLVFPGANLDLLTIVVGLEDTGSGLRATRRVLHCDSPSCTPITSTGISFFDPSGFAVTADRAEAPASYDTTYTLIASLNEGTGIFNWSIAGGEFGAGVSGTADPSAYLAGNASWAALGANALAGTAFSSAILALRTLDQSPAGGSDASLSARFQNVQVGFNNAAAMPWDDFSGTGGNSGPAELNAAKWTTSGANSMALAGGSLVGHSQTTGVNNFQGLTFSNADANTLQADVTLSDCSGSASGTKRVQLVGRFYNDGTPGTTPPNINQPNSLVGDVQAALHLDCFAGTAYFGIIRYSSTTPQSATLLSNANNIVPVGPTPIIGGTHTLRMKWDPATHLLTFQVNDATPVVVDPTTVSPQISVAAPYVKPANSPLKQLDAFLFIPAPGATASMDFRVNNVFTAP
jgi:hypothetical protein